jgi:hypothetical protein
METQLKDGIVKYILSKSNTAKLVPLIIDYELFQGAGLMNPSVLIHDNRIFINLRQTNYTLYHSENKKFSHQWGPLQYLHPENDQTLRTKNWFLELNHNLDIIKVMPIDTSQLDQNPQWHFIGLEDARLFHWEGKFYLCGVRRDDNTKGSGRMQLQEIDIGYDLAKEVSRHKIPAPGNNLSYCEKNWMPILDKPYHFVKWTNPTEIVHFDINDGTTKTVQLDESKRLPLPNDLRGSSQVIPWNNGYLAITHEVNLFTDIQGRKDGKYRHRFVYWDKNFNLVKTSEMFHFMTGEIEFCAGMAIHNNNVLITYGFQDNAAYIFQMPVDFLYELLK